MRIYEVAKQLKLSYADMAKLLIAVGYSGRTNPLSLLPDNIYEALGRHIQGNGANSVIKRRKTGQSSTSLEPVSDDTDKILEEANNLYSKSTKDCFHFLRPDFPDLADCAVNAEKKFLAASGVPREMRYAIVEIGLLAEKIAQRLYIKHIGQNIPPRTPQEDLLIALKSYVPGRIFNIFDDIRRQRNSIHKDFCPFDIEKHLRHVHILCYWFVNKV